MMLDAEDAWGSFPSPGYLAGRLPIDPYTARRRKRRWMGAPCVHAWLLSALRTVHTDVVPVTVLTPSRDGSLGRRACVQSFGPVSSNRSTRCLCQPGALASLSYGFTYTTHSHIGYTIVPHVLERPRPGRGAPRRACQTSSRRETWSRALASDPRSVASQDVGLSRAVRPDRAVRTVETRVLGAVESSRSLRSPFPESCSCSSWAAAE
eukprot:7377920-Prymnesium_polylepis.1